MFTLYSADCVGQAGNCLYPHAARITDKAALAEAVSQDYVCARYVGDYRGNDNFIGSDCLPADCDNDHSDDPEEWKYPSDVADAFPDVAFAVHYSRHHMKEKNGRSARPRFHVLFAIDPETDAGRYAAMKRQVCELFPYFDERALDAARFFFGTNDPQVEIFDGPVTLTTFLADLGGPGGADFAPVPGSPAPERPENNARWGLVIPEGERNATLSRYAARILKRLGDSSEAYARFTDAAACCEPPLAKAELAAIWRSALRFYAKVSAQEDYVPPEAYAPKELAGGFRLMPGDCSDVGQAVVLAREYRDRLRYSPSTDYIVYNGSFWEESVSRAQGLAQELTDRQLAEAGEALGRVTGEMTANGAWELLSSMGSKKALAVFDTRQARSYQEYEAAAAYRSHAVKRRDTKFITAALKEARPMLEVATDRLDAEAFLLNTPSGTYDLRFGTAGFRAHLASDFITKMTAADPSVEGAELWREALETFFCGDETLISYVQEIAGLAAIGKVCLEGLIIAYGEGRNGKSTFWNTLSRVLGTYSGSLSADALTVGCRRNVKPELAEARGRRLIIASELEEGMRLNTATVKQLCSTDAIYAEKKYKDPFSFVPCHTLVLCTNHLPRVGAIDAGTWRRLIVIPFNAKIGDRTDVRNYADRLFEKAGGAVLSWILEGARRVIAADYRLTKPQVVKDAVTVYREDNDWLAHFLGERCETGASLSVRSGTLYAAYRSYCLHSGEYVRTTADFYAALDAAGFERRKRKAGIIVSGLMLRSDFAE